MLNECGSSCQRSPMAGGSDTRKSANQHPKGRNAKLGRVTPGVCGTERTLTTLPAEAGNMAAPKFTSRERLDVYRRIFLLNRSFHFIVLRLQELGRTQI